MRACRDGRNGAQSNIVWNYGHTTIARHLRDLVVTEYGVADLRGASDEQVVQRLLAIADARFVDELAATAVRNGKLPRDFRVPDAWRANTPEALAERLRAAKAAGLLPAFPFGSDFDATELRVLPALLWLKARVGDPRRWPSLVAALLAPGGRADDAELLARLGLARPASIGERVLARLVRGAIERSRAR